MTCRRALVAAEDRGQARHRGRHVFPAGAWQGGEALALLLDQQDRPAGALHQPVAGAAAQRPAAAVQQLLRNAYGGRARTLGLSSRHQEAIKDWEKYLQFEADAAHVYNTIGSCYQAMGKYKESLVPISKAISMNPDPVFYLNRSYSYNGLKELESARKDALFAKQHGIQIPGDLAKSLGIQ